VYQRVGGLLRSLTINQKLTVESDGEQILEFDQHLN